MQRNIIIIAIIVVILSTISMIILVNKNNNIDNTIPNDYIAVFKGETGEIVHTTYLYEKKVVKKNKKTKYKYNYINTVSTLSGYDSVNWEEKVIKKDKLKKKKDIFKKAKKNSATSYVKYLKDGQVYTFEEFKNIWK